LDEVAAQAAEYIRRGKSPNTWRAYESDWRHFTRWCQQHGLTTLPADETTVICYFTSLLQDGRKISTVERRQAAISFLHHLKGEASPTHGAGVRELLHGMRRTHGIRPACVDAVLTEDLRRLIEHLPQTRLGLRNRALLLLGFAGALRRSELVGLDVEDIQECEDGLRMLLRKSKTDQQGEGRLIGIPYGSNILTCPVRAYKDWQQESGIKSGAVFRGMDKGGRMISHRLSGRAVAEVIQRAAAQAGIDTKRYSGHSLRAGHVTTAARAGVATHAIMQMTGHRSEKMVRRYIREGTLFQCNSAASLGL